MPLSKRSSPMNTRSVASALSVTGSNSSRVTPLWTMRMRPFGATNFAFEHLGAKGAFEQIQVAAPHQKALGGQIKFAGQRVVAEQQAAAMRGIGAHRARVAEGQPRIGAAFGAVPVHHVGFGIRDPAHDMAKRWHIARSGLAAHRICGKGRVQATVRSARNAASARSPPVPSAAIRPDAVAARDLRLGQIEHMAEQAADRRAQDVQNVQGSHCSKLVRARVRGIWNRIRGLGWLTKPNQRQIDRPN